MSKQASLRTHKVVELLTEHFAASYPSTCHTYKGYFPCSRSPLILRGRWRGERMISPMAKQLIIIV